MTNGNRNIRFRLDVAFQIQYRSHFETNQPRKNISLTVFYKAEINNQEDKRCGNDRGRDQQQSPTSDLVDKKERHPGRSQLEYADYDARRVWFDGGSGHFE